MDKWDQLAVRLFAPDNMRNIQWQGNILLKTYIPTVFVGNIFETNPEFFVGNIFETNPEFFVGNILETNPEVFFKIYFEIIL